MHLLGWIYSVAVLSVSLLLPAWALVVRQPLSSQKVKGTTHHINHTHTASSHRALYQEAPCMNERPRTSRPIIVHVGVAAAGRHG